MRSLLLTTLQLLLVNIYLSDSQTIYNQQNNPNVWPGVCQTGKKQSPINLSERQATPFKSRLTLQDYSKWINDIKLENDGKSVRVTLLNKNIVPSVTFEGIKYDLKQLQFHWGKSEHALNSKLYDAEIHLLHYNAKNNSQVLSFAGLLKKVESTTGVISNILLNAIPNIVNYQQTYKINIVETLRVLLIGVDFNKFLKYEGSFTTPNDNCEEGVIWIVFPNIIDVHGKAIDNLKQLKDPNGKRLLFTNRRLQNIFSRPVFRSY